MEWRASVVARRGNNRGRGSTNGDEPRKVRTAKTRYVKGEEGPKMRQPTRWQRKAKERVCVLRDKEHGEQTGDGFSPRSDAVVWWTRIESFKDLRLYRLRRHSAISSSQSVSTLTINLPNPIPLQIPHRRHQKSLATIDQDHARGPIGPMATNKSTSISSCVFTCFGGEWQAGYGVEAGGAAAAEGGRGRFAGVQRGGEARDIRGGHGCAGAEKDDFEVGSRRGGG